jgi:hypothetical protein
MKAKLILTVFGVLGLVFITGCTCTQKTSLRCLPCENAKQVVPCDPCAQAPAPVQPVSTCLPCQQRQVAQVQYVAPTPAPAPAPVVVKRDCLDCVNGQPDYSEYQWR